MLRELVDRFAYRYRLWAGETTATRLVLAWHLRNLPQWFSKSEKSGFRVNSEAMRQTNTGLRFWAYVTTVPLCLRTLARYRDSSQWTLQPENRT